MVDGYLPRTGSQWQVIQSLLPAQRRRRLCLRHVFNALLYVCRTGCQWRALPAVFALDGGVLLLPLAAPGAAATAQQGH
ncbi:transposase [Hymenobacter lutimineralis]|uniref:Transposase n=1 Tax=Hymenobacter lutimineralis TaxID=2606448 RepID=A0A5D6UXG4_9BACT|nr:transposase [Hymenobacter lutimineralis]